MAGGPVECLTCFIRVITGWCSHQEFAFQHVTPMRALAHIIRETGKSGPQVGALGKPEIPDGHLADVGDADFDVVVLERNRDIC